MSEPTLTNKIVLKATAVEFIPSSDPTPSHPASVESTIREKIKKTRLAFEQILLNGMQGKDASLHDLMEKDPSGKKFVKIWYLLHTYPQLSQIVKDERIVYSAIRDSMRLELSPCATSVAYSSTARDVKCTVYVDGFEDCKDLKVLYNQFVVFGPIRSIVPCSHVLTPIEEFTGYAELPVTTTPVKSVLIEFFSKKHAFNAVAIATGKTAEITDGQTIDPSVFAGMHIMPMFAYLPLIKKKRDQWARGARAGNKDDQEQGTPAITQPTHADMPQTDKADRHARGGGEKHVSEHNKDQNKTHAKEQVKEAPKREKPATQRAQRTDTRPATQTERGAANNTANNNNNNTETNAPANAKKHTSKPANTEKPRTQTRDGKQSRPATTSTNKARGAPTSADFPALLATAPAQPLPAWGPKARQGE